MGIEKRKERGKEFCKGKKNKCRKGGASCSCKRSSFRSIGHPRLSGRSSRKGRGWRGDPKRRPPNCNSSRHREGWGLGGREVEKKVENPEATPLFGTKGSRKKKSPLGQGARIQKSWEIPFTGGTRGNTRKDWHGMGGS